MAQFTANNCNSSTRLRIQLASLGATPWISGGPVIGPGDSADFSTGRSAGAMRLASVNQTVVSGIYVFTTDIQFNEVFFRTSGLVSSVACTGQSSMEELTQITINNCLGNTIELQIQTQGGALRTTGLRIAGTNQTGQVQSQIVNLPIGATLSFRGSGTPSTTYNVTGNETDIYVNGTSIGTSGCIGPTPPIGNQLFLFGNCFSQLAVLQLLNSSGTWNNVTDSSNQLVTATSGGSAGVPALIGQTFGLYRIQPRNQAASIPFLYTNNSPLTSTNQIWFRSSSPLVTSNSMNACGSTDPGQVVILNLRNCNSSAVSLLVSVSQLQGGTTLASSNLVIPAGTGVGTSSPSQLAVYRGSTLAFSNSSGIIGSTFPVDASLPSTSDLYIGPSQVGTSSMVCSGGVIPPVFPVLPNTLFTAVNCNTSLPSTGSQAAWALAQSINGGTGTIGLIDINGGTLAIPNTGNVNFGAFELVAASSGNASDFSNTYIYTADASPGSTVSFKSDGSVSTTSCNSTGTENMVNLAIKNCIDNSITLQIQANGSTQTLNSLNISKDSTVTVAFIQGSVLSFTGKDTTSDTYTVTTGETQIFVGNSSISTNSCDDANVKGGNPISRNPWVFAIIIGLVILFIIIIGVLIWRSVASRSAQPAQEPVGELQIHHGGYAPVGMAQPVVAQPTFAGNPSSVLGL